MKYCTHIKPATQVEQLYSVHPSGQLLHVHLALTDASHHLQTPLEHLIGSTSTPDSTSLCRFRDADHGIILDIGSISLETLCCIPLMPSVSRGNAIVTVLVCGSS